MTPSRTRSEERTSDENAPTTEDGRTSSKYFVLVGKSVERLGAGGRRPSALRTRRLAAKIVESIGPAECLACSTSFQASGDRENANQIPAEDLALDYVQRDLTTAFEEGAAPAPSE